MHIVLDILFALVCALCIFIGYKRGFFKAVLGFGRLCLSLILTVSFGGRFSAWIDRRFLYEPVRRSVFEKLSGIADRVAGSADHSAEAFSKELPAFMREYVNPAQANPSDELNALAEEWSDVIGHKISLLASTVIGYVLLFILLFAALTVAVFLIRKIVKLPVIRGVDRFLGLGFGVLNALIAATFLATILYALTRATGHADLFAKSCLFKFFYNLHFFRFVLHKIL